MVYLPQRGAGGGLEVCSDRRTIMVHGIVKKRRRPYCRSLRELQPKRVKYEGQVKIEENTACWWVF